MWQWQITCLTVASLMSLCNSFPIDNGVIGTPEVKCEDEQVTLIFNTQKAFSGRIFVKGMSDNKDCLNSFRGNAQTSVTFQLKAGICNMRRQRKLGPQRGVEQSMTVVISFHDTFITKVDRAYRCTCFFMEADKVVTSNFEVSMLPTTDIYDTARMPTCMYHVRRGSITGPIVTYARVGEEVFHVWSCDGDMFGMLVHSCFVDDGAGGNKFALMDQNGCSIDSVILGDPLYNQALNQAYVESHVFRYADKVTLYFQCAISMCMKSEGSCVGITPPNCGSGSRSRTLVPLRNNQSQVGPSPLVPLARAKREPSRTKQPRHKFYDTDNAYDVSSDKIYVLDIDDDSPSFQGDKPSAFANLEIRNSKDVCLTSQGFGMLIGSFVLMTLGALLTSVVMCMRYRAHLGLKTM